MARKYTDVQAAHDIRRAETIIQRTHSISHPASSRVLRECATDIGVSVHAAALAVMSGEPLDPTVDGALVPEQRTTSADGSTQPVVGRPRRG